MSVLNVWAKVGGENYIQPIGGEIFRLVESQEQVATYSLIGDLEEQSVLEELIDEAKPPNKSGTESLHYLLSTPFRYPPLQWGSRFGGRFEPSIFYGGCSKESTLSESAYYRFIARLSIDASALEKSIMSEHLMFSVGYRVSKGVKLNEKPFNEYASLLTDPVDYRCTQQLGTFMRDAGVEAFEYASARDDKNRACVGIFGPEHFTQNKPIKQEKWLCQISESQVVFKSMEEADLVIFKLEDFLIDGVFPLPA